ncbi:hypothetical protein VTJ83DRAFT_5992 [Remersonia thermophila]|uniref:Uncharacterized protein n=1 Tax=Remersonia thermophila TaxID=72144 RepID=A0ABR4D961_9PEZI
MRATGVFGTGESGLAGLDWNLGDVEVDRMKGNERGGIGTRLEQPNHHHTTTTIPPPPPPPPLPPHGTTTTNARMCRDGHQTTRHALSTTEPETSSRLQNRSCVISWPHAAKERGTVHRLEPRLLSSLPTTALPHRAELQKQRILFLSIPSKGMEGYPAARHDTPGEHSSLSLSISLSISLHEQPAVDGRQGNICPLRNDHWLGVWGVQTKFRGFGGFLEFPGVFSFPFFFFCVVWFQPKRITVCFFNHSLD